MIISLENAKKIDKDISQSDLDALEVMIRSTTHNPFLDASVRNTGFFVSTGDTLNFNNDHGTKYLRTGDTVMLADTRTPDSNGKPINDGLYQVESVNGNTVTLQKPIDLFNEEHLNGLLAKVSYPADVIAGVKKLIEYNVKTADNIGIKSRTIARMSETYVDVNAGDNINGYPSAMLSFLKRYTKLRW
ncbi:hypothetical protein [Leuconostoc citreum]|uniref:hypothetical protein n=1 Tax=Leuconostoc citreum TaxID=33964 RepID=UPI0032DFB932